AGRADAREAGTLGRIGAARGAVGICRGRVGRDQPGLARRCAPLFGVRRMKRTLAIVRAQLRASVALALQYRVEFIIEGALAVLWIGVALVPGLAVFGTLTGIGGWTAPGMQLVLGWLTVLQACLESARSTRL